MINFIHYLKDSLPSSQHSICSSVLAFWTFLEERFLVFMFQLEGWCPVRKLPLNLLFLASQAVFISCVKPLTVQSWLWRMLLSIAPPMTATMVPSVLWAARWAMFCRYSEMMSSSRARYVSMMHSESFSNSVRLNEYGTGSLLESQNLKLSYQILDA